MRRFERLAENLPGAGTARTAKRSLAFSAAITALAIGLAPTSARDSSKAAERCAALLGISRDGVLIERAELVPPGPTPALPGAKPRDLPEHCLVRGVIDRRTGVGEREFGIGFELRLPTGWNGRFMFQGGGGLDGQVMPAVGNLANSPGLPALARGFAVASTDSGHSGPIVDASFGVDQQARIDYAYNALDKVTNESKRILAEFYGKPAHRSYFVGCSNGGRQALMASQRLPLEFDGVVAGDPAMGFSRLALGEVWNMQVVARISPKDDAGRPIYSRAFTDDDLQLVRKAVLARCDGLDGLADGFINDWKSCGFHPRELTCRSGQSEGCLSEAKVSVLNDLFQGPMTTTGRHIYGPYTYDTGIASSAWRGMKLGTSATGEPNSADSTLGLGQFRYLQLTPADPDWDPLQPYTVEDLLERIRYQGGIGDADNPLLSTFARKGKMIVYNGMADQGMSTPEIVRWYQAMIAATGEPGREAVRFFGVPGMLHCGGGEATDRFEMLDAIVDWVEKGRPPDQIVATSSSMPGISRPLCPWPKVARYSGGDTNSAASFTCEE
ncbi:tannase/feruloyl esterase family alpha/beta hydrolase [Altererythrobacter salegens]|uniref:Tannase/feruloyl esterase family alpha/beta hydrolase n=1 Tax=Croceibacterium salegens TaxID=1737568 RepID=A0A6I4SX81_9SPHN|nr:tannase/feruloyl esterase family alpha/beta hydrolase [Croceibacterium salegens]MXO59949.1 tannase/feruloyl esterase family alpha/beta hydrolase [Croceibacterium salegens]